MRFNYRAMGPVLVACALLALTSCSKDTNEPNPSPTPIMSASVAAVSAYDIVKVAPMTIDGNLNDWANIATISIADDPTNGRGALNNSAKVKLAWDNDYLYAAYDVTDTELLAIQTTRDHPDLYKDDAVEFYIDPQGDGGSATSMTPTDYHFLANVRETLGDMKGTGTGGQDESFDAASFVAKAVVSGTLNVTGTDVGYVVEMRVSWSNLGVTPAAGNFMRLDVAVEDRDTPNTTTEEFDWTGLTTSWNNPSAWKDVQLVNPPAPASAYDIVKVGTTALTVDGNLSDWTGIAAISMADNSGRIGGVDNTAKVRLAWDGSFLYYAFDVTDTELLAVETARDGANLYKDDEVELYIDPQGDGRTAASMRDTDYQFLANVRDALGDQKGTAAGGKDASYNAATFLTKAVTNGSLNVTGTDVGYALEGRIGWSDLGVSPAAGGFMRIDPAVGDRDGAATSTEEFDWANLSLSFNNPSAWKDVKLVVDATAPATPTNLTLTVVSSTQIDVSWTASTSADVAKYNIYRNGAPTPSATVAAGPYHNTGLTPGTYSYQVSAVDAAGNESAKTTAKSVSTQPSQTAGIPVGPWAVPLDSVGSSKRFTATGLFGNWSGWKTDLDKVRAQVGHVFWSPTTDRTSFLSTRSSGKKYFNSALWHSMWTTNWTPHAAELQSYLGDGTIVGIYMMDEPNCSSCWGLGASDEPITQAQVDTLGGWVKADLPTAHIAVRVVPSWWINAPHPHIDIAWAQYEGPLHFPSGGQNPTAFVNTQQADAATAGLALAFSVNTLDGGDGSSRINGTFAIDPNPNDNVYHDANNSNYRYQMTAAEMQSAGMAFAQAGKACFLTAWRWSPNYPTSGSLTAAQLANIRAFDNRSDVQAAWTNVIAAAKAHAANPC